MTSFDNREYTLDQTDIRILRCLQVDAGTGASQIAQRLGISQTLCWRRIDRLREHGIVLRTVALLDRAKLNLDGLYFVWVRLTNSDPKSVSAFANVIKARPEVLECAVLTGTNEILLKVVAADDTDHRRFCSAYLKSLPNVFAVSSQRSLEQHISRTALPLENAPELADDDQEGAHVISESAA